MRHLYALVSGIFFLLGFQITPVWAQADFLATPTSGCAPLIVNFVDLTPNAVAWNWDFGNSTFSNLQAPGLIYSAPGTYDVQLIVTLNNGQMDTVTKTAYIEAFAAPQAAITASPTVLCEGEDVQFTDLTTPGSGMTLMTSWDFGDGFTSNQNDPLHTYANANTYTITYAVVDENGCSDVLVMPGFITVEAIPDAGFIYDNGFSCTAPFTVNFTANASGAGLVHSWDFGDLGTSNLPNPSHTYTMVGTYDVSHIVSSPLAGCADTVVIPSAISIGVFSPQIQFNPDPPCHDSPITFSTTAGVNNTFSWDFGDTNTSNQATPTHSYATPGPYTVTVDITDPSGCNTSASLNIDVGLTPTAHFATSDTISCEAPFTVDFFDLSTNAVAWLWEFGDGNTSNLQNPTHTYTSPDDYNVKLTVWSADSCSDSRTLFDFIVIEEPTANFIGNPLTGCAPLTVHFTDLSTSQTPIVSWEWDFDGQTSMLQDPDITFTNPGSYDVTLIITEAGGCTDTVTDDFYVNVGALPIADFTVDTTQACLDQQLTFTNLSTNSINCFWDFGDGGNSVLCDPVYTYQDTGFYTVTLIVENNGCVDTLELIDYIYINPPIADFAVDTMTACDLPFTVTFSDSSYGANDWFWDFGDTNNSTQQNPVHTYTLAGFFTAELTVTDTISGCTDSRTVQISVQPIHADFTTLDTLGCATHGASFTNLSTGYTSFVYNFGAGFPYPGPNPNPTYNYQTPGVYTVSLAVSNSIGCTDTATYTDLITVLGPQVGFMVDPDSGCNPLTVQFTDTSTFTAPPLSFEWDFGDNTMGVGPNPMHTYNTGQFDVQLIITDTDGCQDSLTVPAAVLVTEPMADFGADFLENCPNNPIMFSDSSSGIGLSYSWDFGDMSGSNLQNPTHSYANTGFYNVSLTVTDVNGCTHTTTKNNYISINELQAFIMADTTSASCPPLLVNFTAGSNFTNIVSYQWDFGDGSGSTQADPSHIYAIPGTYDVQLILVNETGCTDTLTLADFIDLAGPYGVMTYEPDSGCPPLDVIFNVVATNTVLYQYDFDDGTLVNSIDSTWTHTYNTAGTFFPAVILNDGLGCDVLIQPADTVEIFPLPVTDFSVDLSVLCDSGTVNFSDLSLSTSNITGWEWDFGDGNGSLLQNPIHSYNVVGDYDIRLITFTEHGCSDTLLMPGFVRVVPSPSAAIAVSDLEGCIPLTVDFTDASTPASAPLNSWMWDFGDMGNAGAGSMVSYTYTAATSYLIELIITDTLGCMDTAFESITVHPLPSPDFTVNPDSFGCAPFVCQFEDLTGGIIAWEWDFGDASPGAFTDAPNHVYTQDGLYDVNLIVTDTNNCVNQLTKVEYIHLNHPTADFIADSPLCPGEEGSFSDQSLSDTTLVAWNWTFGDGNTTSGNPVMHSYVNPGSYDVSLEVIDVFGCRDTITIANAVDVLLSLVPTPPPIRAINVKNNQAITINWHPYDNALGDFGEYTLSRSENGGPFTEIFTSTDINELSFEDLGLNTLSFVYCYRLQVRNYCALGSETAASREHCSIELATTPLPEMIELNWSPYIGWDGVEKYKIFRVDGYNMATATLLSSVPGNTTTYVDQEVNCYDYFSYRIEAVEESGVEKSRSDTSRNAPIHAPLDEPSHIVRASVENNESVIVEWDLPQVDGLVEFVVEKDEGNGYFELIRGPITPTTILSELDPSVDVASQSYSYRTFVIDTCGDYSPGGRFGQTIHLTAGYNSGRIELSWTPYEQWERGVERYLIEVYNEVTGTFFQHAQVNGTETYYLDEGADVGQQINCYRITAVESGGNQAVSHSNEACVTLQPVLYAPNAFSPNGDGKNENFILKGTFVSEFRLEIYNRWGEKIFQTFDLDEGWDGSLSRGGMALEGVYVFVATGTGYGGIFRRRSGTVTLIR